MTFVGTFEHTLDKKGRLVLPAKFRKQLSQQDPAYLSPGRGKCLALWPEEQYEKFLDRLTETARQHGSDSSNALVLRALTAQSSTVLPDAQGRVLLTESLLNYARLDRDVVLVGARDHIEIWDRQAWEAQTAEANLQMMQALENGLGI